MAYSLAVIVANLKVLLFTYRQSCLAALMAIGSIAFYYGNVAIVDEIPASDFYYTLTL